MAAKQASSASRAVPITKTREALMAAGYNRIAVHESMNDGALWCAFHVYAGHGELVILHITYDERGNKAEGFDVYVPITRSARVDDTLAAIAARTKAREEARLRAEPLRGKGGDA